MANLAEKQYPDRMFRVTCALLLAATAKLGAQTLPGFPEYVKVPPEVHFLNDGNLEIVDFKTAEFAVTAEKTVTVGGKYFFNFINAEEPLANGWNNPSRIFDAIRATMIAAAWKQVYAPGKTDVVLRYTRGSVDAWAELTINDETTSSLRVVEVASQGVSLSLSAPAAQPENITEAGDFPYLAHYPGVTQFDHQQIDTPFDASTSKSGEPVYVGSGYLVKFYSGPTTISPEQVAAVYEAALRQAGWAIVERNGNDLLAHYSKGGRDLWVRTTGGGDRIVFSVADVGKAQTPSTLKTALDKDCHVPVYGIEFDFNKATLKPEAEPVLTRIREFLGQYPDLQIELQGHTDNVGTRSYNQTLSEQRAAAVRAWLVAKGIDAARLTSKGFADTVPVAPNSDAKGRARNRRVELAKQGCGH